MTPETVSAGDAVLRPPRAVRALQRAGAFGGRNLYWYRIGTYNFGDWIGPFLYRRLTGRRALYLDPSVPAPARVVFSVGSILVKLVHAGTATVWGSGVITKGMRFPRPRRVLAVRGPFTADACDAQGYGAPEVWGDPAILMPLVHPVAGETTHRLGIVPHVSEIDAFRALYGGLPEVAIVDVRRPPGVVADDIAGCEAVASSSLHGLIVAQAYGRPAVWIKRGGIGGDDVKFADHYGAAGIRDVAPVGAPETGDLRTALLSAVADAPRPDLAPLRRPLLEACPWPVVPDVMRRAGP